jgi:hypothetical protein
MKKSTKDRLANTLVDELFGEAGDPGDRLANDIEAEFDDRERVRSYLGQADQEDIEKGIDSARALIDRLDLTGDGGEISWDLEYRVQHARGVLANAFFALYGGFGERPAIEA